MKKIFLSIFLISFIFSYSNAEEVKQYKEIKKKELSKSDEEFLKKFKKLDEELKQEQAKTKALERLEKTVDELRINKK
ncbi:MAG: hypothetical protein NTW78_11495 [Campylobacterales bacterium]|nr:hypothetical protein [Campylobacterales bacterium]